MKFLRQIHFYKHYFREFYLSQTEKVQTKIDFVLGRIATEERLPVTIFKKIESVKGLYEIRIEYESNIYRIFCCNDEGHLIILFNAFQKKTQKAPTKEINKAVNLMKEYFDNK